MLLYFGFDYDAAIRAFEEAAQRDPAWSVPRWGIALSLGPNTNDRAMEGRMAKAYAVSQAAVMLARDEDTRARDLANALAQRYTDQSEFTLMNLNHSYSAAMKRAFDKYPLDDDIATLYVESRMLTVAPSPHQHTTTDADAVRIIVDGGLGYANEHRLVGNNLSTATLAAGGLYTLKLSETSELTEDGHFVSSLSDGDDWRYGIS